ncbi:unnamed protein product, partial [Amoebophrya sp. A25]|eukprot:GSA25T00014795001.1
MRVSAIELVALIMERMVVSEPTDTGKVRELRAVFSASGIEVTYCGDEEGKPTRD